MISQGSSSYDPAGRETYSRINEDSEYLVSTYSEDGNLLERSTTGKTGKQKYHSVYLYDQDGKETEYLSSDESSQVSYRCEYHYKGDLEVEFTSYSNYNDTEYVRGMSNF